MGINFRQVLEEEELEVQHLSMSLVIRSKGVYRHQRHGEPISSTGEEVEGFHTSLLMDHLETEELEEMKKRSPRNAVISNVRLVKFTMKTM